MTIATVRENRRAESSKGTGQEGAAFRVDVTTRGTRISPLAGGSSPDAVFLPGMYLLRPANNGDKAYYLLARCPWSFSTERPLDPGTRSGSGTLSVSHSSLCLYRASLEYSENWESWYLSLRKVWQYGEEGSVVSSCVEQFEDYLGVVRPMHTDDLDAYPVFVAGGYLSLASHRRGYSGGAHSWYDLRHHTLYISDDSVAKIKLRHLFPVRWWWLIRWRLVHYFMKEWDRVDATETHTIPNREWMKLLLALGMELEDVLVTQGPNGPRIHLTFDTYTVHCFARGGGRLSLDRTRVPNWIWKRILLPDVNPPAANGPPPCDLDTEPEGVFANPEQTEEGLPRPDWLVTSYTVTANDSRLIDLVAQHVEQRLAEE
jgi:hypothetical protein